MNPVLVSSIICPRCYTELSADSETCSHCGTSLRTQPAARQTEVVDQGRIIDRPWLIGIVLLHIGFLGIPLYWKTSYSVGARIAICLLSIAYTVFAVAVIVWGF